MKKILFVLLSMLGFLSFTSRVLAQPYSETEFTAYNTGQEFDCITVDSIGNIWAGTDKAGLFHLDKAADSAANIFNVLSGGNGTLDLNEMVIQSLAADNESQVWVGHAGKGFGNALGGGVERININNTSSIEHLSPDRDAKCFTYFERDGIGTRNCMDIDVDKNGNVWTAHRYNDLFVTGQVLETGIILLEDLVIPGGFTNTSQYILTPGTFSRKPSGEARFNSKSTWGDKQNQNGAAELPYPAFTCDPSPIVSPQSRIVNSIAVSASQAWVSVYPYQAYGGFFLGEEYGGEYLPARILRYDLNNNYLGSYDFASIGIPPGGVFNGIFLSPKGHNWVSISARKGFAVQQDGVWSYMGSDFMECFLPPNTSINQNAIWGNQFGNVFLGTNNGLLVYNGRGPVQAVTSYTFFKSDTSPEMISNNIKAGASKQDSIQWLATDNGIMEVIIGRYDTVEDNPEDCNNVDITTIENQDYGYLANTDISFHTYQIITEICNQDGPNPGQCTAEQIFTMMVNDVTLTTPTPFDFPNDLLIPDALNILEDDDLINTLNNINAWEPSSSEHPAGGIDYIKQVSGSNWYEPTSVNSIPVPFYPYPYLVNINTMAEAERSRSSLMAEQESYNPTNAIECSQQERPYRLYNSANYILGRYIYKELIEPNACDSAELTSAVFAEVWIHVNEAEYTITNYTARGHLLYPGTIKRTVVEECGTVKVITDGVGINYCGNNDTGRANGKGNVIVGGILFKNIDLRLKKAFEDL